MAPTETTPLLGDDQRTPDGLPPGSPDLTSLKVRVEDGASPSERRFETSPVERELVRRLDIFLMTFGCISQIIK